MCSDTRLHRQLSSFQETRHHRVMEHRQIQHFLADRWARSIWNRDMDLLLQKLGAQLQFVVCSCPRGFATIHPPEDCCSIRTRLSLGHAGGGISGTILPLVHDFHCPATQRRTLHVSRISFPRSQCRSINSYPSHSLGTRQPHNTYRKNSSQDQASRWCGCTFLASRRPLRSTHSRSLYSLQCTIVYLQASRRRSDPWRGRYSWGARRLCLLR